MLRIKRRFAKDRINHDMIEKEFQIISFEEENFKGDVGFITIHKVAKKWEVPRKNRAQDCIMDDGYKWLEIYPNNKKYAIIAMYDENSNIVEWYFDVAKQIGRENGMPYVDDLYLDIVITYLGEIIVLDEEELEDAFNKNEITQSDFQLAKRVARELIQAFQNKENVMKLREFTDSLLEKIKKD